MEEEDIDDIADDDEEELLVPSTSSSSTSVRKSYYVKKGYKTPAKEPKPFTCREQQTQLGTALFVSEGREYIRSREKSNVTYFKCRYFRKYKCKGKALKRLDKDGVVRFYPYGEHVCMHHIHE